jgi:hypothetical protein
MRKYIVIILLSTASFQAKSQFIYLGFAQLFVDGILSWQEGGYEYKHTWFGNETAQIHGLKGGWFLNDNSTSQIGFSLYVSYGEINKKMLYYRQDIAMIYSTIYYEHTFRLLKRMDINPYLHLGWGMAYTEGNSLPQQAVTFSQLLLTEPGVNFYFRIFNWCKIGGGFSYRNTFGSRLYNANDQLLSAPNINLSIKFGNYKEE